MFSKVVKYLGDVRQETAKVIWPPRKELQGSAIVVIVMSLILAVFVFGIDFTLGRLLKLIL